MRLILVGALVALAYAQGEAGPHVVNSPNTLFQAKATSIGQLDPCQYLLANLTTTENLMKHEVATLEQCLYYYLAGESAKKMLRFNIAHPIASVPPNYISQQPVTVSFAQFTLQHFELNEFMKDIAIHGYLDLNWHDDRLMWDKDLWKKNELVIHSFHHVWLPVLGSQNPETHLKNGDAFEVRKVDTTYRGNVTAKVAFSLRTFCDDSDFENYPYDVYKCCFGFEPQNDREVIQFASSGLPIFTDPKNFRDYGWSVSGTVPESFDDPSDVAQLGFCLNLKRASSAIKVELTVPLFITTFLFLLPPLFGNIKTQAYLKIFILLLQFLTMIVFTTRLSPHLSSASATPKPLRFLEVSMTLNMISIAISIFIFTNMMIRRTLPPWGKVGQLANAVNGVMGVLNIASVEEFNLDKLEGQSNEGSYQKDWNNVFKAAHAIIMALISIFMIFAYFILLL